MLATNIIDPEDLYTISAGGFSATADAFARDDDTDGLWFVLDGRLPDRAQSHLGLPAQAAPRRRPHHPGRGRHGPLRRLPALRRPPRDGGHLDDQDSPHAGLRRLARPGLHQAGGVQLRAGLLPAAGPLRGGSARVAPPLPRQAQPAAPAPLLGRLALAQGPSAGDHRPPPSRVGVVAYRCSPKAEWLREDLSQAVASGRLTLPREEEAANG